MRVNSSSDRRRREIEAAVWRDSRIRYRRETLVNSRSLVERITRHDLEVSARLYFQWNFSARRDRPCDDRRVPRPEHHTFDPIQGDQSGRSTNVTEYSRSIVARNVRIDDNGRKIPPRERVSRRPIEFHRRYFHSIDLSNRPIDTCHPSDIRNLLRCIAQRARDCSSTWRSVRNESSLRDYRMTRHKHRSEREGNRVDHGIWPSSPIESNPVLRYIECMCQCQRDDQHHLSNRYDRAIFVIAHRLNMLTKNDSRATSQE